MHDPRINIRASRRVECEVMIRIRGRGFVVSGAIALCIGPAPNQSAEIRLSHVASGMVAPSCPRPRTAASYNEDNSRNSFAMRAGREVLSRPPPWTTRATTVTDMSCPSTLNPKYHSESEVPTEQIGRVSITSISQSMSAHRPSSREFPGQIQRKVFRPQKKQTQDRDRDATCIRNPSLAFQRHVSTVTFYLGPCQTFR